MTPGERLRAVASDAVDRKSEPRLADAVRARLEDEIASMIRNGEIDETRETMPVMVALAPHRMQVAIGAEEVRSLKGQIAAAPHAFTYSTPAFRARPPVSVQAETMELLLDLALYGARTAMLTREYREALERVHRANPGFDYDPRAEYEK